MVPVVFTRDQSPDLSVVTVAGAWSYVGGKIEQSDGRF